MTKKPKEDKLDALVDLIQSDNERALARWHTSKTVTDKGRCYNEDNFECHYCRWDALQTSTQKRPEPADWPNGVRSAPGPTAKAFEAIGAELDRITRMDRDRKLDRRWDVVASVEILEDVLRDEYPTHAEDCDSIITAAARLVKYLINKEK